MTFSSSSAVRWGDSILDRFSSIYRESLVGEKSEAIEKVSNYILYMNNEWCDVRRQEVNSFHFLFLYAVEMVF